MTRAKVTGPPLVQLQMGQRLKLKIPMMIKMKMEPLILEHPAVGGP